MVWEEEQKFAAPVSVGNYFVRSVDISGEVIMVGAVTLSGEVRVFRYNGTDWDEEQVLFPRDWTFGNFFGYSVSVSGDLVAIGAYGTVDAGNRTGSAYVYRYNGFGWVEEKELIASPPVSA